MGIRQNMVPMRKALLAVSLDAQYFPALACPPGGLMPRIDGMKDA